MQIKTLPSIFHHFNVIERLLFRFTQTYPWPSHRKTRWSVIHICAICWKWRSCCGKLFWLLCFLITLIIYCHLRWKSWWKAFAWKCCHTQFAYFFWLWHLRLIFYLFFLLIKGFFYFNILISHKKFIFEILIKYRPNVCLILIDHFTQRSQINFLLAKWSRICFLFEIAFHNHFLKILIFRNLR